MYLKKTLDRLAFEAGFIRRKRGFDAYAFLVMITFGLASMPFPSLAGLVGSMRSKMSREALHQRFTNNAVTFLKACVELLLRQKLQDVLLVDSPLLKHFKNIRIVDSSSWHIPAALKNVFPGCGGNASEAGCKIQVCYEYLRGALSFFDILPGNRPDQAWSRLLPQLVAAGDLVITDLGYFCLKTFRGIAEKGAFFLSRFLIGTALWDQTTGKTLKLCKILQAFSGDIIDIQVTMGALEQSRVCCRLVCLRVSSQIAKQRRDKLTKTIWKKKKKLPCEQNLYLCNWTLMITNAPACWLSADMVRPFYSLRWQIELLFKQLKSVLAIDSSPSAKEPRVRCELLGRMIVAILINKMHAQTNAFWWNNHCQEISMDKFYKRIHERAFVIKDLLLQSVKKTATFLVKEIIAILKSCRKLHQKSRLSSLEYLHQTNHHKKTKTMEGAVS